MSNFLQITIIVKTFDINFEDVDGNFDVKNGQR